MKKTGLTEKRRNGFTNGGATFIQYECDCGKLFWARRNSGVKSCGHLLTAAQRKQKRDRTSCGSGHG